MSNPQFFTIIVISEKGEYASTVASILDPTPGVGYSPEIIAVSFMGIHDRNIYAEGLNSGFHINDTIGIKWINPKLVDLWLALDENGEKLARRTVKEKGPAPRTYYRGWFPDPVVRCEIQLPNINHYEHLGSWILDIKELMNPWKGKIFKAFYESS
jgi:hypothetical protein